MKKLLLSSIIMFGVCGIVTAQSATDTRLKAKSTAPVSSLSPTPQKSASAAAQAPVAAPASATTSADIDAARSPEKVAIMDAQQKIATSTTVNAAGEVIVVDDATQQKQIEKAAAVKAANAKRAKSN